MTANPRIKLSRIPGGTGNLVQVEAFVSHLMEAGESKDKNGNAVPRDILNNVICKVNGKIVFAADLAPAIAANPYLRFTVKAKESVHLVMIWRDDNGTSITGAAEI
jgi:sulfur-oxidizing protein SoxZ